jgi:hypothetical protein
VRVSLLVLCWGACVRGAGTWAGPFCVAPLLAILMALALAGLTQLVDFSRLADQAGQEGANL